MLNPVFPFDCNYFCHQIQWIRPQYIVDKLELLICVLDSFRLKLLINRWWVLWDTCLRDWGNNFRLLFWIDQFNASNTFHLITQWQIQHTVYEEQAFLLYRRIRTIVKVHFLLEILWISEPSLGIMEKFQHSLALPNTKYNCSILFLCQMYWSFVYVSKYFLLIDHHCKTSQIRQNCPSSCRVLMFGASLLDNIGSNTEVKMYFWKLKWERFVYQWLQSGRNHINVARWRWKAWCLDNMWVYSKEDTMARTYRPVKRLRDII